MRGAGGEGLGLLCEKHASRQSGCDQSAVIQNKQQGVSLAIVTLASPLDYTNTNRYTILYAQLLNCYAR